MNAPHVPERKLGEESASGVPSLRSLAADENEGVVLALGGGFSRGFAHLGVLEALEQAQIPISAIVGTSIGGLLGAAYADGISLQDLCDLGRRVRIRDFLRFQQTDKGSERKDCLGRFVREWFRATSVEELRIPTFIVTTDLCTGAPYVFARGPLDVAIRASCAFPGLFKPVEYEGLRLGDGCIAAPVPTSIAARIDGGCVIGVAVGSNMASASFSSGSSSSVVKVFDSGFRSSHRSALEPSWSRRADILLEPEVHQIDWNDFSRVDEAFAAGAEAMRRALPSVRESLLRRPRPASALGISAQAEGGFAL